MAQVTNREMVSIYRTLTNVMRRELPPSFLDWAAHVLEVTSEHVQAIEQESQEGISEDVQKLNQEERKLLWQYASYDERGQIEGNASGGVKLDPEYENEYEKEVEKLHERYSDSVQKRAELRKQFQDRLEENAPVEIRNINLVELPYMTGEEFLALLPVISGRNHR